MSTLHCLLKTVAIIGKYVEFIYCGCFCGKTRPKYDERGIERKFIRNHQCKGIPQTKEFIKKRSEALKGHIVSEETRRKISEARKGIPNLRQTNEKHHAWKGDGVGYRGLHLWMNRHLPKPEERLCMLCHKNPIKEVANITGIYNREFKNWAWFCRSCHKEWDNSLVRMWIKRKTQKKDNQSSLLDYYDG